MSVDIYLDEKKFISVKRASQETGYTQDYIGQLSRAGRIPAKLIGRSWFVDFESLLKYKQSIDGRTLRRGEKELINVDNKGDLGRTSTISLSDQNFVPLSFASESVPPLPTMNKHAFNDATGRSGSNRFLVAATAVVAFFSFFGGAYSWVNYLEPSLVSKIDESAASYYENVLSFSSKISGRLNGLHLAQVENSINDVNSGIVVFPDSKDQQKIDSVKQNFSDDVEVYFDEDEQSGVIKPVFRSGQVDEDYAFVMVPIKKTK